MRPGAEKQMQRAGKTSRACSLGPKSNVQNITYEELAMRLKPHGVTDNAASIANKLARGTFAAAFFLVCLEAPELDGIRLEDI